MSVPPTPAFASTLTTHAVFSDPYGVIDSANSPINHEIVDLINSTPAGQSIEMSTWYAQDMTIPNALINAHQRGVNVRLIFDTRESSQDQNQEIKDVYAALTNALGTDVDQQSYVYACPANQSCFNNVQLSGIRPINHNKFFLFSQTKGANKVVVESSANLHDGRDNNTGWNDALVLVNYPSIYDALIDYVDEQLFYASNGWHTNNVYSLLPPVTSSDNKAKIHFFPRIATGCTPTPPSTTCNSPDPYNDPGTDTIMTVLNHVSCFGNTKVGAGTNHQTVIRVATDIFSRVYIAQKLAELDALGCYVEVADTYDPSAGGQPNTMSALLATAPATYSGVALYYYCATDPVYVHSKFLQVEGDYYGVPDRSITWMGSANLSTDSLRSSDETILQWEDTPSPAGPVPSGSVFDQFRSNFTNIRQSARTAPNGTPVWDLPCGNPPIPQ